MGMGTARWPQPRDTASDIERSIGPHAGPTPTRRPLHCKLPPPLHPPKYYPTLVTIRNYAPTILLLGKKGLSLRRPLLAQSLPAKNKVSILPSCQASTPLPSTHKTLTIISLPHPPPQAPKLRRTDADADARPIASYCEIYRGK
jgi:hypothetical protein